MVVGSVTKANSNRLRSESPSGFAVFAALPLLSTVPKYWNLQAPRFVVFVIVTSSVESGQPFVLWMVQRNTFGPSVRPFTTVLRSDASTKVPVPLTTVHVPVPTLGLLAA